MISQISGESGLRVRRVRVHVPICTLPGFLASFSHISFPSSVIDNSTTNTPVVLTIAGSDSSAGAGIQADLKTFSACGCYGVNAVTALVSESPRSVHGIALTAPTLLAEQLKRVKSDFPVLGAKTGMLGNASIVGVVADFFEENPELDLVIDPVMRASAGAELLDPKGLEALIRDLIPKATLITPNLPEAEILLGRAIKSTADMKSACLEMNHRFGCSVLIKGGHFSENSSSIDVIDRAAIHGALYEFKHPRLDLPDLHGTGCTLSAAITAQLACGDELFPAIEAATEYLSQCMIQHHYWPTEDDGIRALNHFPDRVE